MWDREGGKPPSEALGSFSTDLNAFRPRGSADSKCFAHSAALDRNCRLTHPWRDMKLDLAARRLALQKAVDRQVPGEVCERLDLPCSYYC